MTTFETSHDHSSTQLHHVVEALRAGKPVLVADSFTRENEVDVVLAAQTVSQDWMAWTIAHTSGYICVPMTNSRADSLLLPLMVATSEDDLGTSYCIAVDAKFGTTTGISAHDRALTARLLASSTALPSDFKRPGHVLPLRAREGGLRERAGHTEAAVDLCRLAGLEPVGVIAELVGADGQMMRYDEAASFARTHDVVLVTVAQILGWLDRESSGAPHTNATHATQLDEAEGEVMKEGGNSSESEKTGPDQRVSLTATAHLPSEYGDFTIHVYADHVAGTEHVAMVSTMPGSLVRVHSECLTGDILGSLRCDCGPQLHEALRRISVEGGALIYVRGHEGRGIGLSAKIQAYALQERGLDTVDANLALGYPEEMRTYDGAAAVLLDLARRYPALNGPLTLLSNNPAKANGLTQFGIEVGRVEPIVVGRNDTNAHYLDTKAARMGHQFPLVSREIHSERDLMGDRHLTGGHDLADGRDLPLQHDGDENEHR